MKKPRLIARTPNAINRYGAPIYWAFDMARWICERDAAMNRARTHDEKAIRTIHVAYAKSCNKLMLQSLRFLHNAIRRA